MRRFAPGLTTAAAIIFCSLLIACGSSSPTHVVANEVPGVIDLTPSPNVSLELGQTQPLIATAKNAAGTTNLTETFTYLSTSPSVVTVANNGDACAGTWNSLATPTVCTPGAAGTAQVTAVVDGVSSAPVTFYVHQHITAVSVSQVPGQAPTLSTLCLSKAPPSGLPESTLYQASAFSGNVDITQSVGPFTWQTIAITGQTTAAVSLSALPAGTTQCFTGGQSECLNMQRATAASPGATQFFASADGVNSPPVQFTTCPVQSITLSAIGNPATSFTVPIGTATTLNATVKDILGQTLTGVPLTWSSNNQESVKATGSTSTAFGSTGSVSASAVGAGAVTASCTPPTCNGGITPSLPIYPTQAISFIVQSTSAPANPTVSVTSTGCNLANNGTNQGCIARIVPLTRTSTSGLFNPGTPINLPFAPNSILYDQAGTNAYLGVNSLGFGTQGAMVFSGTAATGIVNVAGKALATSPDGTLVIFADTVDTPNQVFVCQSCSTSSQNAATFLFNGATAAAFSVDQIAGGYKAYVVSGESCPGTASAGCLLVYSKVDAVKIVPLSSPATDVAFIGNGTLGYIAGGEPSGSAFLPTCDDPSAAGSIGSVALPAQLLRPLYDGQSVIALDPPNLQQVTAQIAGTASVGANGCPAPRGFLGITNQVGAPYGVGVSSFTPVQFFLSPDGMTAYILGQTGSGASAAKLPFIIAFDITTETTTDISLAGNAIPLSASLSPGGDLLFVGANDGTVHVIDTATFFDQQQVTFPFPQSSLCVGPGNPPTAVQDTMTITDVAETGTAATYSYISFAGPPLQVGETIEVTGMANATNNGTFTIGALGTDTFTVTNPNGVTASGQNGAGASGVICNPDLVAVKP